jgi:hypothetical protein
VSRYGTLTAASATSRSTGLALKRDAEPGDPQHVDVVGTVSDRDGLRERHPGPGSERLERRRPSRPVATGPTMPPVSRPSRTSRVFGHEVARVPSSSASGPDHLGEAAAHERGPGTRGGAGSGRRARTGSQPDVRADDVEGVGGEAGEQPDPRSQGRLEVELAGLSLRSSRDGPRRAGRPPAATSSMTSSWTSVESTSMTTSRLPRRCRPLRCTANVPLARGGLRRELVPQLVRGRRH